MNSGQGFSLIELLVTLVVAGTLIGIAVPGYRNLVMSNRLSSIANDYVAALSEARLDAVRRNSATQFCGLNANGTDDLGASCNSTVPGQVSALDSDGEVVVVRAMPTIPVDLTLRTAVALRYGGQGLAHLASGNLAPHSGLIIDISAAKLSTNKRRCIYLIAGSSLSTCTSNNATTCPTIAPSTCQ